MANLRAVTHGAHLPTAVRNGIVRSFMTNLQPRQLQYLIPPGEQAFKAWIAKKKAATNAVVGYDFDVLEDKELRILWLGKPNPSSAVILFLHGA